LNDTIAQVFAIFCYVLIGFIIVRSVLSFFPAAQGSQLTRLVYQVTEPLLEPVRRILPRTGSIDFSGTVVVILLYVLVVVVRRAADG
jgi:YggT family protein